MIGKTLSHFKIVAKLGEGGMGEVYRAQDLKLDREVAIKVLPLDMATDPERLERFEREAKSVAALNHPNIIMIHSVEQAGGTHFLAMELVEGDRLDRVTPPGGLEEKTFYKLAIQLADAIAAAHEKAITHRDLKPGNVMVTDEGRVKVLDFGLAKLEQSDLDDSESETLMLTQNGLVMGTVPYMSPEQVQGRDLDYRSDIFSLGILLYEMATGDRPFRGENNAAVISAIMRDEPEAVSNVREELPNHLSRIIRRCLAKEAGRRPQSAKDICTELEELAKEVESTAIRPVVETHRNKTPAFWLILVAVAIIVGSLLILRQTQPRPAVDSAEWTQITHFTDSVTSPSLSPDGRMLTYLRGDSTFVGAADLYIQMFPNGEPVQLTRDGTPKMSPKFSPDGSEIAYSSGLQSTNIIPVLGGESREFLGNASGLTWIDDDRVLFSEIRTGIHMSVVTSNESRADLRDVYVPGTVLGMAHRSYLSPDGHSVLIAEMDDGWLPCRVVPFDGGSKGQGDGQVVGPPEAPCVSGAWSPDGRYVYLSAAVDGEYHIWRQRYPDGEPERVTSGTTQEEGVAMFPDGKSFITSVGTVNSAVWLASSGQVYQVTFQGDSAFPVLSSDGQTLYYLTRTSGSRGKLMRLELGTESTKSLLPGFTLESEPGSYDVSPDQRKVAFLASDETESRQLWLARLDGADSPRRLPAEAPSQVRFGPKDEIFYDDEVGKARRIFRVRQDGSDRREAFPIPVVTFSDISSDGEWVIARMGYSSDIDGAAEMIEMRGIASADTSIQAHRLDGSEEPVVLCRQCFSAIWGPRERFLYLMTGADGTWLAFPIPEGQKLPDLPKEGVTSQGELGPLGQIVVEGQGGFFLSVFYPGLDPSIFAVSRQSVHRNLYQIPISR